jgi:hypothetical protein
MLARTLLVVSCAVFSLSPGAVAAQETRDRADAELDGEGTLTLSPSDHERLLYGSIEGERAASLSLYVAGPLLLVGGAVLGLVGWLLDATYTAVPNWYSSSEHGLTYPILGACVSGLGAALLGIAIGLDVDHRARHRAIEQRFHWSASVDPLPGGGAVSIAGTF